MAKLSKCINCGAELTYSPKYKNLKCKSCGTEYPVSSASGYVEKHPYSAEYNPEKNRVEETQYVCPSCGSKILAGREKTLSICASCGNTALVRKNNSVVVPDGIIPFEIDKEKASEIFQKFVRSRKFAPSDLAVLAKMQKVIGFYAPVWKMDFEARTRYSFVGVKKYVDKNDEEQKKYYNEDKTKEERFQNVLISGNKQISEIVLEQINDYDFSKAVPYSSDYVLGFYLTDTNRQIYSEFEAYKDRLDREISKTLENKSGKGYNYIEDFSAHTRFADEMLTYVAVPIYANHYTYKNKTYHCYINGQTGKCYGSAPKSFWKILATVGGCLLGVGAIALLLIKLL